MKVHENYLGSEFKVVAELYHDDGVFSLRVKQIV